LCIRSAAIARARVAEAAEFARNFERADIRTGLVDCVEPNGFAQKYRRLSNLQQCLSCDLLAHDAASLRWPVANARGAGASRAEHEEQQSLQRVKDGKINPRRWGLCSCSLEAP
jgi:hypothetical protein